MLYLSSSSNQAAGRPSEDEMNEAKPLTAEDVNSPGRRGHGRALWGAVDDRAGRVIDRALQRVAAPVGAASGKRRR